MNRLTTKLVFLLILMAFCNVIHAKPLWCTGTVNNVYVDSSSNVIIHGTWRNQYTLLCNLENQFPGTVTCSTWMSLASIAVKEQLPVTHYFGNVDEQTTCNTLPTYAATPATGYFMLKKAP